MSNQTGAPAAIGATRLSVLRCWLPCRFAETLVICAAIWTTPGMAAHAKAKSHPPASTSAQGAPQAAPAKPKIVPGSDPGGVAVALIGTGVNYTLPQIAGRLARDGEGDIIGLDFIDRDNRPYDVAEPDAPPDGIRPFGTTLASVMLAIPPIGHGARLVPVRIALGQPRQFGGAAAFVAATHARIAVVAFSSSAQADWEPFRQAALAAPHVLFILPAGDGGADLDTQPHYPASLGLPNALVVTSCDLKGRLLPGANSGPATVDMAISAVDIQGQAIDGKLVPVAGTAYAAARAAFLAASLLWAKPNLSTAELKTELLRAAKPVTGTDGPRTKSGSIIWFNTGPSRF